MKKFLKISGVLFLSFVFLFVFIILFLPYLLNLEKIKNQIEKQISKRLQAEVNVSELRLSLLPHPGLKLKNLELRAPTYFLRVQAVSFNFQLKPLFKKHFEIQRLILKKPYLIVSLSKGRAVSPKQSFQQKLNRFLTRVPLIDLTVQDGDIKILCQRKELLRFEDLYLKSDIRRDQILLEAQSRSDAWKNSIVALKFWPQTSFIEGILKIEHLDLSKMAFLSSRLSSEINTDLSMGLSFRRENNIWYLGFRSIAPCFAKDRTKKLIFSCKALLGEARLSPNEKWVSIKQAVVKYPEIVANGEFRQLKDKSLLKIEIKKADFTAWRQKLLPLTAKSKSLSYFFKILRKAYLGKVSVVSIAATPKELLKLENIKLEAEVFQAEVQLPIFPEPLKVNKGLCNLYDRFLYVKNADGIYKDNSFTEGKLKIYLFNRDKPFLFEANLKVNAQEALVEVKRLVKRHKNLYRNLNRIKKIQGRAEGHLKVYGSLRHPKVDFSIKPQKVFLYYDGFPLSFTLSKGLVSYADRKVTCISLRVGFPKSGLESLSGSIDFTSKPFFLNITEARGIISIDELNTVLKLDSKIRRILEKNHLENGQLYLVKALFKGPFTIENFKKRLFFEAHAKDISIICARLPARLEIKKGLFSYKGETLSFGPVEAKLLDAQGVIFGQIFSLFDPSYNIFLKGQAEFNLQFIDWIFKKINLSKKFFPSTPLKSSKFEFFLQKDLIRLSGHFITGKNATLDLSLEKKGPIFRLSKVKLFNRERTSQLSIFISPEKSIFYFHGCLKGEDLEQIFSHKWLRLGILEGQIKGTYYFKDVTHSEFNGELKIKDLNLPWKIGNIFISDLEAQGKGSKVLVKSLKANIKQTELIGKGKLEFMPKNVYITGTIHTTKIILEELIGALKLDKTHKKIKSSLPLILTIDLNIDELLVRQYTFEQVKSTLFYYKKQLKLVIEKANFCNINLIGEITWSKKSHKFKVSYSKKSGDLNKLMVCFFNKPHVLEGVYTLDGSFTGYGKEGTLWETSSGKLFFTSPKGKIYKFGLMVKLFAFLNPIDIFRGKLPDLSQKGFSYDFLEVKGHFEKQYFVVDESQIQGTGLRIFASGKVDLKQQKIYLTALISPFVEADILVSGIPVIGWILTGKSKTFFSIPVDIRGDIKNPEIIPLDPRAVSKKVLGIIERSLKLPVKVFIPRVPATNQGGK